MIKSDKCHHIAFVGEQPNAEHRGNVFLGSIGSLKKVYIRGNQIGAVLTILDNHSYEKYQVDGFVNERGLAHKWINLEDREQIKIEPHFDQAAEFINQHLQNTNVLVHCLVGRSRSASFVIAFLMKTLHISMQQALQMVKSKRQFVKPNEGFIKELFIYETRLKEQVQE